MELPTIAAIIPTYRREPFCLSVLGQLRAQDHPPTEIIVADQTPESDYSPDGLRALAAMERGGAFTRLVLPEPAENRARNEAAEACRSEVLLYVDDDVELPPEFVRRHLLSYCEAEVAAVTGRVIGPERAAPNALPVGYEQLPAPDQAHCFPSGYTGRLERTVRAYGGNFSVRREVLLAAGGWNERLVVHTDLDLGLRLAELGHRIAYDPAAWLRHLEAPRGGERSDEPWRPFASRTRAASSAYFGFRYPAGRHLARWAIRTAARHTVLKRGNVLRPWRLPAEAASLLWGLALARQWAGDDRP